MIYFIRSVQHNFTESTVFSLIEGIDVKTSKKYYSISHLDLGKTIELENKLYNFENQIRWTVIRNINGSQAFEYYRRFSNDEFEIIKNGKEFIIKCKIIIKDEIKRKSKKVKSSLPFDRERFFKDVMPVKMFKFRENILNSLILFKQDVKINEITKKTGIGYSTLKKYIKKYEDVKNENPELSDNEVFEIIYPFDKKKMLIDMINKIKIEDEIVENIDENCGIIF